MGGAPCCWRSTSRTRLRRVALLQDGLKLLAHLRQKLLGLARADAGIGQRQQRQRMHFHDLAQLGQLVQGRVFQVALTAVYELLQEMSLRDLTMEKVAKRAGVGKPTLYRWWKTKAALVIAMFNERIVPEIDAPPAASLEESIRHKVLAR